MNDHQACAALTDECIKRGWDVTVENFALLIKEVVDQNPHKFVRDERGGLHIKQS